MLTRHTVTLAAAVALSVGLASPAFAGGKVVCDKNGNCTVIATNPGNPGGGGGGSSSPGGGGGGGGGEGEDTISPEEAYQQWCLTQPVGVCGVTGVATPGPGAPATPTATPAQAAQQAVSQLPLRRPDIGAAPCNTDDTAADCMGTVGLPVWVWTEPWTPATATATAGPYTVTATATISSVRWELGDGTQFTCTTPGTEFNVAFGFRAPDCGKPNGYQKAGDYAITATYQWDISWSGATSGSTTMQTRATTPTFPVSELQAVVTHH